MGKNTSLTSGIRIGAAGDDVYSGSLYADYFLYPAIYKNGETKEIFRKSYTVSVCGDLISFIYDYHFEMEVMKNIELIEKWDTTRNIINEYINNHQNCKIDMYNDNIYCYEDSVLANLKKEEENYNCNVQYITSDTKIPTIPEQKPNNPTTTTTKYTTLSLTTINNQLYVKGINPESNTVEQIIKSGEFAEGTTVKVYKYGQEIANSEKVGTGSVIKVLENGEVKEEYIVVVYGDTDGDGEITSIDALAIVKNKTGKIPFTTEAQKEAARLLTKTGTSGAVDALAIVKSRTGKAVINQENGTVSKK